jgi:hypothetical protein
MESNGEAKSISVTFIGFFELEEGSEPSFSSVVRDPGKFVSSGVATGSRYRLIRLVFEEGQHARVLPAFSDLEVIPEQSYDWSNVPSGIQDNETAEESVARVGHLWKKTGVCPDPGMYEVRESQWLRELGLDPAKCHHYILLGHDEYIEVIAAKFEWRPGQAVA